MTYDMTTPHLRVPLRIHNGVLDVVEQDSIEEVEQCVEAIVRTPVGSYELEPELGISDPTFSPDISDIKASVDEWEPRAATTITQEDVEDTIGRIRIDVDMKGAI